MTAPDDRWNDEAEQAQFAREQQIWLAKAARRKNSQSSLLWGLGALLALILLAVSAHAADPYACFGAGRYDAMREGRVCPDSPSGSFCWLARRARDVAGSEKAAEDAARTQGVSEATIAKAKRCPR
jgi:hypothetical protein